MIPETYGPFDKEAYSIDPRLRPDGRAGGEPPLPEALGVRKGLLPPYVICGPLVLGSFPAL